jgi:hypothetical protein
MVILSPGQAWEYVFSASRHLGGIRRASGEIQSVSANWGVVLYDYNVYVAHELDVQRPPSSAPERTIVVHGSGSVRLAGDPPTPPHSTHSTHLDLSGLSTSLSSSRPLRPPDVLQKKKSGWSGWSGQSVDRERSRRGGGGGAPPDQRGVPN